MSESSKQTPPLNTLVNLFGQTQVAMQTHAVQAVNTSLVVRNWLFGWYIVEFEKGNAERAELYGKKLLQNLAAELKKSGIKGMSLTSLKQFRQFYETYKKIGQALPDQSQTSLPSLMNKVQNNTKQALESPLITPQIIEALTARFSLSWTHYTALLTVKNTEERRFYELEAVENGWGYRELERQIHSALYERLSLSRDKEEVKKLATQGQLIEKPEDVIKSPYILEFTGLEERQAYSEYELETALIDKIEHFLLELGKGFLFESRQKRFSFANQHFYVDLVFYNRLLKSYVIIDLKIGELKHQDLGQMQMYVNYFDRHVKLDDENPTVGILLCLSKNDELVELTLPENSNVYASEYQLYLPSKEELKRQLEEVHSEWEQQSIERSDDDR